MPVDPLVKEILSSLRPGVTPGLEGITALLAALGDPHREIPVFHIGGTNGKGSTAAMAAAVLQAQGFRVGLHTSPHLVELRERFLVAGSAVGEEALREAALSLRPAVDALRPSFFEATVALAFQLFRREGVEVAVLEVGLGGRLDATNVVLPLAAGVTGISRDHVDFLGESLDGIAREKAGIAKPGVPFLTTEKDPHLRGVLEAEAVRRGATVLPVPSLDALLGDSPPAQEAESWLTDGWSLGLRGEHQRENARLALGLLAAAPGFPVERRALREGLSRVQWPGRLDVRVVGGAPWLLDVAHNLQGARLLAKALESGDVAEALPRPRELVVGILGDKEWREMLTALAPQVDRIHLVQPSSAPGPRRWDLDTVAEWAIRQPFGGKLRMGPGGLEARLERVGNPRGGSVVVTGSTHTVGDTFRALGLPPYNPDFGLLRPRPSG